MQVEERFLKYVAIDTQSISGCEDIPSTAKQFDLARLLVDELHELGVEDANVDDHCYVMGSIPSNLPGDGAAVDGTAVDGAAGDDTAVPAFGLISHMDTATESSGAGVRPRIVRDYDGGSIVLNEELGLVLDPAVFEELGGYKGDDIIVTDGRTLLGADDKAGVAEIMTVVERLHDDPSIPHGRLCIGFTPDEEVGNGPALFDIARYGADLAYTVYGGRLGELEYENFNAATAVVTVTGNVVHPGTAKNKMRNAAVIAAGFQALMPPAEVPEHTEGREGFFHLVSMEGGVASAKLVYLIRDFQTEGLERRKALMESIARLLNEQLGVECVNVRITDAYRNMKEAILPHFELVTYAQAAMEEVGVTPAIKAIRGGTDGAELSFRGLPCPNICTGSENYHGPYEYISIQSMHKVVDILLALIQKVAGR